MALAQLNVLFDLTSDNITVFHLAIHLYELKIFTVLWFELPAAKTIGSCRNCFCESIVVNLVSVKAASPLTFVFLLLCV